MSREWDQVAALVALLKALPDRQLSAVLDGLEIRQEDRPEPYQDKRRCKTCGFGWVRHKLLADHPDDGHEWRPDRPIPLPRTEEEVDP